MEGAMRFVEDTIEAVLDMVWGVVWFCGRVALEIIGLLAFLGLLHGVGVL